MIICCCNEAYSDCEYECPKGIALKPKMIVHVSPWNRKSLKFKREMRDGKNAQSK